jgi:adenine-specific DNA-methyltransferase
LLRAIISASSNENSIVMDFFCGSGTTLVAALELNRRWIGIDKSNEAIRVTKAKINNLQKSLFSNNDYSCLETSDTVEALRNNKVRHFA